MYTHAPPSPPPPPGNTLNQVLSPPGKVFSKINSRGGEDMTASLIYAPSDQFQTYC